MFIFISNTSKVRLDIRNASLVTFFLSKNASAGVYIPRSNPPVT